MKAFLQAYKWWIIVPLIALLVTAVLVLMSSGPQKGPFIYQIH